MSKILVEVADRKVVICYIGRVRGWAYLTRAEAKKLVKKILAAIKETR